MPDQPQPLAVIRQYRDLVRALYDRQNALDVSGETLDHLSGLTSRYSQKVVGIRPQKALSPMTFGALAGALAVKFLMVEDEEQLARIQHRLPKRRGPRTVLTVSNGTGKHSLVSLRFLRKIAPLGGVARAARMNPSWRRGIARRAARARWSARAPQ